MYNTNRKANSSKKIISLLSYKNQRAKAHKCTSSNVWNHIMNKNKKNNEKLQQEREQNNKTVLISYKIKKSTP